MITRKHPMPTATIGEVERMTPLELAIHRRALRDWMLENAELEALGDGQRDVDRVGLGLADEPAMQTPGIYSSSGTTRNPNR